MLKKIASSRIFYGVLSVILAISIWAYVIFIVNPDDEQTFNNIQVVLDGVNVLTERGLVVTSMSPGAVTLRVTGNQRALALLDRSKMSVVASVAAITEPREYELALTHSFSDRNLEVSYVNYTTVHVTVERMVTRSVELRTTVTANAADGYQMGTVEITPTTIEVSGAESEVRLIHYARVNISGDDLTESAKLELPIELIGYENDNVLTGVHVTSNVMHVQAIVPIVVLREVPLTVLFTDGGGATADDLTYEIFPQSIYVSGDENSVEGLDEIVLGKIDLSKMTHNRETMEFPIALDSELTNESGISTATVTVTLQGLSTKSVDVTNIQLINAPTGFQAERVTQSRMVLVRGVQADLESIEPHQLRIVADLSEVPAAGGTYKVMVKVYLDSNGQVGVVGNYDVVISLVP